jgi:hypothetical protein
VNLVSAPFMDSGAAPAELPMWKDPEIQAMAKSLGVPIALALFGALVLLGLVRPLLKGRNTGPGASSMPLKPRRWIDLLCPHLRRSCRRPRSRNDWIRPVIWPSRTRSRWRTS